MITICQPHELTVQLLGRPEVSAEKTYHKSIYMLEYKVNEGLLLYNSMTRHVILLNSQEIPFFEKVDINNEISRKLIEEWFLIDDNTDERVVLKQTRSFLTNMIYNSKNPIIRYTILPTTACNARCFYCFERDRRHIHMTPQIAYDVAKFIIRKSEGQPVKFHWFGGEPLYNLEAIDIICSEMKKNNIEFVSSFTSNGYLFDEKTIQHAKEYWNIKDIQITLDGTEEVYNRVKNYIYEDVNAYQVVMQNIQNFLNEEILVAIRLNMDTHNVDDLSNLVDILYDRFGDNKRFVVYSHLLFEDTGKEQMERSTEDRHALIKKHIEFQAKLNSLCPKKYKVEKLMQYHQCQADDPAATIILPDGNLGKCEHYSDTDFWGNIYSDEINQAAIDEFRRFKYLGEKCDNCPIRPTCFELARCANTVNRCDEMDYFINKSHIDEVVLSSYKRFVEENPDLF